MMAHGVSEDKPLVSGYGRIRRSGSSVHWIHGKKGVKLPSPQLGISKQVLERMVPRDLQWW